MSCTPINVWKDLFWRGKKKKREREEIFGTNLQNINLLVKCGRAYPKQSFSCLQMTDEANEKVFLIPFNTAIFCDPLECLKDDNVKKS